MSTFAVCQDAAVRRLCTVDSVSCSRCGLSRVDCAGLSRVTLFDRVSRFDIPLGVPGVRPPPRHGAGGNRSNGSERGYTARFQPGNFCSGGGPCNIHLAACPGAS